MILHMCFSFHLILSAHQPTKPTLHALEYIHKRHKKIATVNAQQARTQYNFKGIRRDYSNACQVGFIS
jgi:hypothetical protein